MFYSYICTVCKEKSKHLKVSEYTKLLNGQCWVHTKCTIDGEEKLIISNGRIVEIKGEN